MALYDAGLFDRLDIVINASDANLVGIEAARRGVYAESRVRDLTAAVRLKYFRQTNEGWQVIPELHNRIRWILANLIVESDVAELATSDVIFCHNVFIYFSESAICQTLRFFECKIRSSYSRHKRWRFESDQNDGSKGVLRGQQIRKRYNLYSKRQRVI